MAKLFVFVPNEGNCTTLVHVIGILLASYPGSLGEGKRVGIYRLCMHLVNPQRACAARVTVLRQWLFWHYRLRGSL